MIRGYIIVVVFLLCAFVLNAQKINISMPNYANKEFALVLNKGIKQDTIQKGTFPFTGKLVVNIPEQKQGYVGMGVLYVKDQNPINLIVSQESFDMELGADSKFKFSGSKENTYLYSIIQEKAAPAADSTLYASHFVNILRFAQRLNTATSQNVGLAESSNVRLYALNHLDLDRLYTSGVWYHVIDGLVKLPPSQDMMGKDMVRMMKKIKSEEVFKHLAENLIMITEQFGLDDAFDIIVPYIKESGRITVPTGNMYSAFALAKIQRGSIAPDLQGLKTSLTSFGAKKTLLAFYQPDCENCHAQMEKLKGMYPKLKADGVRIISISSEISEEVDEGYKKTFPWAEDDKLCDLNGFAGKNFITYGITSSPIFFLLDEKSKVIKRYALISDIDFSVSNVE